MRAVVGTWRSASRPEADLTPGGSAVPTPKPNPDDILLKALVRAH
jgi:hypothetical protein